MASRRPARRRRTLIFIGFFLASFALAALVALARPLVPAPLPAASPVTDDEGREVGAWGPLDRESVAPADIPTFLRKAVVATEDRSFYQNPGVDARALVRAALVDLRLGRIAEGGSTITQQLARNLYLTPRRSLARKLRETALALRLTRSLPKDEILALYLNDAYFGEGAYGIEAASEAYFNRPVRELEPAQAALLAGLLRAPSADDPYRHPKRALERRRAVLEGMVEAGMLVPERARTLEAEPLRLARPPAGDGWVLSAARRELSYRHPHIAREVEAGRAHPVALTIDAHLQEAAEKAVDHAARRFGGGTDMALVAMDPRDGAIRALVGGRRWTRGAFDAATEGRRPVASTFKPILFASALEDGLTPATRLPNTALHLVGREGRPYTPASLSLGGRKEISLREALAASSNWAALRLMERVGPSRVRDLAARLGFEGKLPPDLTLALGSASASPLMVARVYSAFANGGWRVTPHMIQSLDGVHLSAPRASVLPRGIAYLTTDLLRTVATSGTAQDLGLPPGVAAKTGTGDGRRDGWIVLLTPRLVVAAWVGGRVLPGDGSHTAGPIAKEVLLASGEHPGWEIPPEVVQVEVSAKDGLLPNGVDPTVAEVFLRGTEPTAVSPVSPSAGNGEVSASHDLLPMPPRSDRPSVRHPGPHTSTLLDILRDLVGRRKVPPYR